MEYQTKEWYVLKLKLETDVGHILAFSKLVHCSEKSELLASLTFDFAGLQILTHCSMKSLYDHRQR